MTWKAFRELLQSTLDDQRFSRSERRAVSAVFADDPPTDHQLAEFRHLAFDLAREALAQTPQPEVVLNWLEEVIKLLQPRSKPSEEPCIADVCFSPGEACRDRIAGLIRSARDSVDVCVYTITDNEISQSLIDAHRRGVHVRVISDDRKSGDAGSDIHRFRAAGVAVRVDQTRHHMHHKFALFDGRRLVTGSYNWTVGAALDNEEHIVILSERQLIARFQREFEKLWAEYA